MSITAKKGSTTVASFAYARDGNGQLTSMTPTGAGQGSAESYAYTQLNQLSQLNGSPFAYDTADNLTTLADGATISYDAANEATGYTPPGGAPSTLAYDAQGNRVSGLTPSGGTATYGYDQADRLVSSSGGSAASYSYDGDGLRVTKTTGATTRTYIWDLAHTLPLLLSDGSTSYLYDDQGLPIEQITGSTTLYYQHDELGSTRLLTTGSGATAATYRYDPYGNLAQQTGATDTPLRYAAGYQDPETGLYYLRARYYDPRTAQFLTRDPIAPLTQSPYAYVGGNPLNLTDPTGYGCGFNPTCWAAAAVGAASGTTSSVTNSLEQWGATSGAWVYANRGTVASVVALGWCFAPGVGWVSCGVAASAALAIRLEQRTQEEGFRESLGPNTADVLFSAATFGLLGTPAAVGLGEAPDWLLTLFGTSRSDIEISGWGAYLAKLYLSGPDIVGIAIGLVPAC